MFHPQLTKVRSPIAPELHVRVHLLVIGGYHSLGHISRAKPFLNAKSLIGPVEAFSANDTLA
jgi:hypothetical protein